MKIKLIHHVTNTAVYIVMLQRDPFLLDHLVIDAVGNERRGFSTGPNRYAFNFVFQK